MIPQYNTVLLSNIWDNEEEFLNEWKESGIYDKTTVNGTPIIPDANVELLFFLLYSKYGNSPIANMDTTQFKYKVWTTMFQFGPTWVKRLEIQGKVRALTDEDIVQGSKIINNKALNPNTIPGTGTLDELDYINEQTSQNFRKSKLEGYSVLMELIENDVTGIFLEKFRPLFKQFVLPDVTNIYVTEGDE